MILSDRYSEFHACVRIDRQRRQWRRAMQVFSTALPTYAELNGLGERLPAIYRSLLGRSRCAAVITCWTVDRETLTSFAIAAGLSPASNAARINRSCPGVTVAARSGSSGFARAAFAGGRLADLAIVQQAQAPAQVGRQGDPRFMRLPVETGVGGGRIRRLPRRAFVSRPSGHEPSPILPLGRSHSRSAPKTFTAFGVSVRNAHR